MFEFNFLNTPLSLEKLFFMLFLCYIFITIIISIQTKKFKWYWIFENFK